MSKFCPNCGATLDDAAVFCTNCGGSLEAPAPATPTYQQPAYQQPAYQEPAYQEPAYQQPAYQQPAYQEPAYQQPAYQEPAYQQPAYQPVSYEQNPAYAPQEAKKPSAGLLVGIGAAAIAVILFLVLVVFRAPYTKALKNYMMTRYMIDPSSVSDLMPDEAWIDMEDWTGEGLYDYEYDIDDLYPDYQDYLEEEYGYDFKFSYEIRDRSRVSDSKLHDIAVELEDYYYIDRDDITKAFYLTVKYTYDGDYDYETETLNLLAIKIDGQWYIMEPDSYGGWEFIFW